MSGSPIAWLHCIDEDAARQFATSFVLDCGYSVTVEGSSVIGPVCPRRLVSRIAEHALDGGFATEINVMAFQSSAIANAEGRNQDECRAEHPTS